MLDILETKRYPHSHCNIEIYVLIRMCAIHIS